MKNISLNVGDEVVIRSDLINGEEYGDDTFVYQMIPLLGKKATIKNICGTKYIMYGCGNYNFTEEMIDVDKTYKLQNKIKWVPKINEKYWYIGTYGIQDASYYKDEWDNKCLKDNNCFRTRRLARIAKKKIEDALMECEHE